MKYPCIWPLWHSQRNTFPIYFTFNLKNLLNDPFLIIVIIRFCLQKKKSKWEMKDIHKHAISNMFNIVFNKCFLCSSQFCNQTEGKHSFYTNIALTIGPSPPYTCLSHPLLHYLIRKKEIKQSLTPCVIS